MTNTHIQGTVPLSGGTGLVDRPGGSFNPGEYAFLENAEVVQEGSVRGRRSLLVVEDTTGAAPRPALVTAFTGAHDKFANRFVGHLNNWVIAVTPTAQIAIEANTYSESKPIWAQSNLPAERKIVGAFAYNKVFYWITQDVGGVNDKKIYIYSAPETANIYTLAFATLTVTNVLSPEGYFRSFFIHKERLFIATDNAVYFSKATDPLVFTVPQGGFFKLEGKTINDSFAINDSIFTLTNRSIEVFTYSVDPNSDAQNRTIAENFSADAGCVHQSTPYVANSQGIFTIVNNYVQQVASYRESKPSTVNRIMSSDDSLIVFTVENQYPPFEGPVVFNVATGTLHTMTVSDRKKADGHYSDLVDGYNPPVSGARTTLFIAKQFNNPTYSNTFYRMFHVRNDENNLKGIDRVATAANGIQYVPIPYKIEVRDIQPDQSKYIKKKFRSLVLTASLPKNNFRLRLAFDGILFTRSFALGGTLVTPYVSLASNDTPWYFVPVPASADDVPNPTVFRVPMNQRASSMAVRFELENRDEFIIDDPPEKGLLELFDLRFFWLYTSRLLDNRNNVKTP